MSRRGLRALLALPLPWLLSSCGACLLVHREDVELRTPTGQVIPVRIEFRTPDGILNTCEPLEKLLLGFLLEPVDWVFSTSGAWQCMFDDNQDVQLGPLGWLLTLTPFATLVATPTFYNHTFANVDEAMLARLRAGEVEAAREAFGDWRIRELRFR